MAKTVVASESIENRTSKKAVILLQNIQPLRFIALFMQKSYLQNYGSISKQSLICP
jgi:hypothetical protein